LCGKNLRGGEVAVAEAAAALAEARRSELDLTARARAAYFQLANAHEQLGLNQKNVGLLRQFADISRAKYEAGTKPESDVLAAQIELSRLEEARFDRHLDFKSNIIEGFLAAEIYPTALLEDDPSSLMGRLRPYAVIGIGVFHFNPQGSYIDPNTGQATWVYLRPLHTEGQGFPEYPDRKEYGLTQLNIPIGVGIKYYISQNVNLSLELIHRKTFTDYIDDVSTTYIDPSLFYAHLSPSQAQIADAIYNKSPLRTTDPINYGPGGKRGDTKQKDAYFTLGFKLGIRLTSDREWRNSTRCPSLRF